MYALTSEQMKYLDHFTIHEYGISAILLMEHAAISLLNEVKKDCTKKGKVLICSGPGNNGADGLALARLLIREQYDTTVYIFSERENLSKLSMVQYDILKNLGAEIIPIREKEDFSKNSKEWDLIVDALFGVSLVREIGGIYKEAVSYINNSKAKVLAVDIPSGVDATTGKCLGEAVKAYKTVTFASPKVGLYLFPGAKYSGEIVVGEIGIPERAYDSLTDEKPLKVITGGMLGIVKTRLPNTHKGSYGHVLVVAGSKNMSGAAMLSAKAAYKVGAGLVSVFTDSKVKNSVNEYLPEAICYGYSKKDKLKKIIRLLKERIDTVDAVLIGPGLSKSTTAKELVKLAISSEKRLIIDADAINIISEDESLLESIKERKADTILTPHIGEMSRLTKRSIEKILNNPLENARSFAEEYAVTLVLKSAWNIIANKDGETFININGNNGMATGGSGDVLAGIIAGLSANKNNDIDCAAKAGAYIHGGSGQLASEEHGRHAMLASDIIDEIRNVLR